jgi:hypothetical protein
MSPLPVPQASNSALVANLERHAHQARGAYTEATERALRSDTAIFTGWCTARGLVPLPAAASYPPSRNVENRKTG